MALLQYISDVDSSAKPQYVKKIDSHAQPMSLVRSDACCTIVALLLSVLNAVQLSTKSTLLLHALAAVKQPVINASLLSSCRRSESFNAVIV